MTLPMAEPIMKQEFFATTAKGMEALLEQEIRSVGCKAVRQGRSGVAFEGTLETAYRVCLWSRIANRVLLPLKTFDAPDEAKLYAGVKSINWARHLTPRHTIAVDFSTSHSQMTHSQYGALKTKDAICDQLRSTAGERPSVNVMEPDVRINVYLLNDVATVSIDLSGASLHRRGYREEGVEAPLKENLAAAVLMNAGWPEAVKKGREDGKMPALMDPMCGSGTLLIEAAMMAARIAPGLSRQRFGFTGWLQHDQALWERLLDQARKAEIKERKLLPKVVGYDRDFQAIRIANSNIELAGMTGKIHVEKRELAQFEPVAETGIVVVNPPYGERLGDVEELVPVYKELGDLFKKRFAGWQGYILTSSPDLMNAVGLKASRRFVLFNGAIECRLLKYEMYAGTLRKKSESDDTEASA